MNNLRALLAKATDPGSWERVTEGNHDQRHAAGAAFLTVMATRDADNPAIEFSDLTWVRLADGRNVCMVGNGPKQTYHGDLIAEAIRALPALLDVAEAARTLIAFGPSNRSGAKYAAKTEALDALDDALERLDGAS